jgi:hypothetical protein
MYCDDYYQPDHFLLGMALIMIFIFGGIFLYVYIDYQTTNVTETIPILSLRDNSRIYGEFALGSGVISSEAVYVFYIKNDDGSYSRNNIDADITKIYMDENEHPYLLKRLTETKLSHYRHLVSGELHVPNGTIVMEYNVGE